MGEQEREWEGDSVSLLALSLEQAHSDCRAQLVGVEGTDDITGEEGKE